MRTRRVTNLVFLAEDSRTDDATNTTSTDQSRRAERSFPLPSDVVRLPRENTWHVGVAGDCCKKDAKISYAVVLGETEKWQTYETSDGAGVKFAEYSPMREITPFAIMNGDRMWYLSPAQANAYITMAAATYGGEIKHSEAATLKPMPSFNMMGRKYAIA